MSLFRVLRHNWAFLLVVVELVLIAVFLGYLSADAIFPPSAVG